MATGLVIEAVFKNMEVKKAVFSALDTVCKDTATLATNTSTLNVDDFFASICNKNCCAAWQKSPTSSTI